jgi:hypothetical protein
MKGLLTFLLLVSTINLLWFPVTDGVHEVLHAIKSRIHDHGHYHSHSHAHSNKNQHHSHRVEEHSTIKSLLNVFASVDDQKHSVTVILFLFFSAEVVYFFLSPFAGELSLIPENQQYNLHITPPTPPPLV